MFGHYYIWSNQSKSSNSTQIFSLRWRSQNFGYQIELQPNVPSLPRAINKMKNVLYADAIRDCYFDNLSISQNIFAFLACTRTIKCKKNMKSLLSSTYQRWILKKNRVNYWGKIIFVKNPPKSYKKSTKIKQNLMLIGNPFMILFNFCRFFCDFGVFFTKNLSEPHWF